MTVLVTVDDALEVILDDTVQTGPYQTSQSGRELLALPSMPFGAGFGAGSLSMIGGRVVSYAELYRSQPWVWAAVNKRYRPIIRLPLKVYEINSQGDKQRVRRHPLVDLVDRPWTRGSPAGLKQAMFAPKLVHGNALLVKERSERAGPPRSFRPLDWRMVTPTIINGQVVRWESSQYGSRERFAPEDVLWLQWWGPDGFGISPLEPLGTTVRIEQGAQRYQEAAFQNGARPPSAVEASESFLGLDPVERKQLLDNLRSDITLLYSGPENAGRPALLPPGLTWNSVGHTAHEAELIEQRRLAREEVAAVYDIPPTLIGNLDKATYSNITEQGSWLWTDLLGPDVILNEQELKAQVIDPEPAFEGLFVEYDFSGVLRGKKLEEVEAMREAISIGLKTPNEGRRINNDPVFGDPNDKNNPANKLYMPLVNNLAPIDRPPPDPAQTAAAAVAAAAAANGHH